MNPKAEGGGCVLINRRRIKVSRRGAVLTLFGAVFVLIGYSYLNIPAIYKPLLNGQLRFALSLAPIEFYGGLWIAAGVFALVGGLCHRLDWLGFAAAVFMPCFWSLAYWAAEVIDGIPRAWVSGVVYGLLGAVALVVSGMPDPLDEPAPTRVQK